MHCVSLVIGDVSVRSWCVPAGHGSGADAPRAQNDPGAHGAHSVPFGSERKDPASHGAHSVAPQNGEMLPGVHADGATLPVAQLEPGGHSTHCSAADKSVAFE